MRIQKLTMNEVINVLSMLVMMSFFFLPYMGLYFKVITFYSAYILWSISCYCMDGRIMTGNRITWIFLGEMFLFAILFMVIKSDDYFFKKFITTIFISYNWGWALSFYRKRKYLIKIILPYLFLMLLVGAVTTYIGCQTYPMASRILATGTGRYDSNMVQMYKKIGIGGYDFIYSLVFIMPSMMCMAKVEQNYVKKLGIFIIIIVGSICVLQSGYSTGILCLVLGISYTFILLYSRSKRPYLGLFFILMGLLLVWLFKTYIFEFIGFIGDKVGAYYVSVRMSQLSLALIGEGVESLDRFKLYHNALMNFFDSPILGSLIRDKALDSGHSEILNYLEVYGVWGLLYVHFLISNFNRIRKRILNVKLRMILMINQGMIFFFACINRIDPANGVCMISLFLAPIILEINDCKKNRRR